MEVRPLSAESFFNYNTPSVTVMEINEFAAIKLVLVGTV
jgi:hypothetical protein